MMTDTLAVREFADGPDVGTCQVHRVASSQELVRRARSKAPHERSKMKVATGTRERCGRSAGPRSRLHRSASFEFGSVTRSESLAAPGGRPVCSRQHLPALLATHRVRDLGRLGRIDQVCHAHGSQPGHCGIKHLVHGQESPLCCAECA